jgi:uncharacterized membrane protein YgcG
MNRKLLIAILLAITFSSLSISHAKTTDLGTSTNPVVYDQTEQYERILNFKDDIFVNEDSSLNVTESITVYANNETINHGIYRDFPTIYNDSYGNKYKVDFKLLSVKNNNQDEDYTTSNLSNGIRIKIGKADTILSPGFYTYVLNYVVTKELGFFETEDVLYWNVTGNGWNYVIDKAEATVHLPTGVPLDKISTSAYTGAQGSKAQDFYSTTTEDSIYFSTTQGLGNYEGLTIAIGWPKGFVQEPTKQEKFQGLLMDNIGIILGIISFIIILLYYLIVWVSVGRDPRKGSIIAEYDSPENLSPASLRFNFIQGYDNSVFTSAIISMAVKGYLIIDKTSSDYKLIKTGKNTDKLSVEESIIADNIFIDGDGIKVNKSNYIKFQNAQLGLKTNLEKTFLNSYFITNKKFSKIGLIVSALLLLITSIFSQIFFPVVIFLSAWLSVWSFALFLLLITAYKLINTNKIKAIVFFIIAIPFTMAEITVIKVLIETSSLFFVVLLSFVILINILFFKAIKRRTKLGRALEDKIEGFRMFLSVTEEDRLNFANPPEKTPELFEKFLPYALALGVEQRWSEQFSSIFNMADDSSYHHSWYVGSSGSVFYSIGAFTGALSSSFANEISSSSVPPGSRGGGSSSHGGGSSGGGGGGGGGGGW